LIGAVKELLIKTFKGQLLRAEKELLVKQFRSS
jgi:hypothetical protein